MPKITAEQLNKNLRRAESHFTKAILVAGGVISDIAGRSEFQEDFREIQLVTTDEINEACLSLVNKLNRSSSELVVKGGEGVTTYVKTYDVEVKGIDYYKCAYFYAIAVFRFLHQDSPRFRVIASVALIYLMDDIIKKDLGRGIEEQMRLKLVKSVAVVPLSDDDPYPWRSLFGEYGLYMIFKIVYKCCQVCNHRARPDGN